MGKILNNKNKVLWVILTSIFYISINIAFKGHVLMAISQILKICGILLYANMATSSIMVSALVGLCSYGLLVSVGTPIKSIVSPELFIILLGILNCAYVQIKGFRSNKVSMGKTIKDKVYSVVTFKSRPIKIKMVYRVILYSIIVTVVMSLASSLSAVGDSRLTLISSLWVILPTMSLLATMVMISDMYILGIALQVVTLYISYMQITLGQVDIVSMTSNIIILATLIFGYLDYIRLGKVSNEKDSIEQLENK